MEDSYVNRQVNFPVLLPMRLLMDQKFINSTVRCSWKLNANNRTRSMFQWLCSEYIWSFYSYSSIVLIFCVSFKGKCWNCDMTIPGTRFKGRADLGAVFCGCVVTSCKFLPVISVRFLCLQCMRYKKLHPPVLYN